MLILVKLSFICHGEGKFPTLASFQGVSISNEEGELVENESGSEKRVTTSKTGNFYAFIIKFLNTYCR